jgi:hypothetical protein
LRSGRLLVLLLAAPLTVACVNVVSIDAEDSVNFANIEVSMPIGDDDAMRVRFRGAGTSGEFSQDLDLDERIQVDESRIGGPARVEGEIDLDYYSIAFGWDRSQLGVSSGKFYSSSYFGLAQTNFDLTLEGSEGRRFQTSDDTVELYMQYGIYHALTDSLDIGFSWAISLGRELSGISEIDLKMEYELYRQLRISGGYRWFDYSYGIDDDESSLEVNFRGPFVGLNLPF